MKDIYYMRSYSGIFSSCSSILDKEDLSSISEEQVWVDETLTTAFPERTVCFHPELGYNSGRCK